MIELKTVVWILFATNIITASYIIYLETRKIINSYKDRNTHEDETIL